MKKILFIIFSVSHLLAHSQSVPNQEENIPYLVTFGAQADKNWGDDDFSQTFFFVIPKAHTQPVFIRVFDPETGGNIDELKGTADSKTKFSVYGGKGCISNKDARGTDPVGLYRSGNLLAEKQFTNESQYDNAWYTFGPFNPTSGELMEEFGGYVFKIIAEGVSGNDGNLYRYFLTTSAKENIAIEGANAFTYEYTFRLNNDPKEISHLYPFLDSKVVSVKQRNFDWDNDGEMKFVSKERLAVHFKKSEDGKWAESEHQILEGEKNASIDVQFHKNKSNPSKNNNMVFYITNQYNEALPFFVIPIGGVPKPPGAKIIIKKSK